MERVDAERNGAAVAVAVKMVTVNVVKKQVANIKVQITMPKAKEKAETKEGVIRGGSSHSVVSWFMRFALRQALKAPGGAMGA